MKVLTFIAAVVLVGGPFLPPLSLLEQGTFSSGVASAEEGWRKEFDEVCSKTQDAMLFPPEELRKLVGRCDALKAVIEKLDESQRRVTLRRLQMCRELYQFVLETKESK
jgi:hypothetical protein